MLDSISKAAIDSFEWHVLIQVIKHQGFNRSTTIYKRFKPNGPPTETFITYDDSPSPGADDYLIRLRLEFA